jgi:hypothetical protein
LVWLLLLACPSDPTDEPTCELLYEDCELVQSCVYCEPADNSAVDAGWYECSDLGEPWVREVEGAPDVDQAAADTYCYCYPSACSAGV